MFHRSAEKPARAAEPRFAHWTGIPADEPICGSPDQLGPDELRTYQAYLLKERKLAVGTVVARVAALRFFLVRTSKRHEFREDLPYPKDHRRLPTVLSLEEVSRLINAAGNLMQRALMMSALKCLC